ncbi:unnamed protein product [Anisakis simplex]|uniref:SSD domain-containing protein n=1 Tax=Anisakis simplex TaxID=6269 RepID=A0A0M3JC35_ANISI|nr:unnamed protein product [Anisakis simplex]
MDVRSRVSHGLSEEGYSFTKYFLLEMCFLLFGYITFIPEIQEFCTFAFIGLVVDFYMQQGTPPHFACAAYALGGCRSIDGSKLISEGRRRVSVVVLRAVFGVRFVAIESRRQAAVRINALQLGHQTLQEVPQLDVRTLDSLIFLMYYLVYILFIMYIIYYLCYLLLCKSNE